MKHLLLLLISTSLLMACTRLPVSRKNHQAAGPQEVTGAAATSPSGPGLQTEQDKKLAALASHPAAFAAQFAKRLDLQTLEVEKTRQSAEQRAELFATLNQGATLVSRLDAKDETRKTILTAFSNALLAGCEDGQPMSMPACRYIHLLTQQPGAVTLALALADDQSDIVRRYRFLALTLKLANRADDNRALLAYASSASEFEAKLKQSTDSASRTALDQHRAIVTEALSRPEIAQALASRLSTDLRIWDLDRVRESETAQRELLVLEKAASSLFAPDKRLFQKLMNETTAKSPAVAQQLRQLDAESLRTLGVANALPESFQTFLFENLWMGRLTDTEAQALWESYIANRKNLALTEVTHLTRMEFLNYAKTRLLLTARAANKTMIDFFKKSGTFTPLNVLNESLKATDQGRALWAQALERFEILRRFSDRNLPLLNEGSGSLDPVKTFFDSLDRNIALLSTYPSTFVMTYHFTKLGMKLVFKLRGNETKEVLAGEILDWFFSGELAPLMDWGPGGKYLLNKSELLLALSYAIEMGTFNEAGIELESYFTLLSRQMLAIPRERLQQIDLAYQLAYEDDPQAREFNRVCSVLATKTEAEQVPAVSLPITLQDLRLFTVLGFPETFNDKPHLHKSFQAAWSFFELERSKTNQATFDNLERVRLGFSEKLERMSIIADIIENHLRRHTPREAEATMKKLRANLAPLEQLRAQFYSRMFRISKTLGACGERLGEIEREAEIFVISGLVSHFRDVHAAMKDAYARRAPSEAVDKRFGFSGKAAIEGLERHETNLGFTTGSYSMSKLQVLLRVKTILEQGYRDGEKTFPAKRTAGSITLLPRLRDYADDVLADTITLQYREDINQFVTQGLQQIFNPQNSYLDWIRQTNLSESMKYRLRSMVALAKAGRVQTLDGEQQVRAKELARIALKMDKWLDLDSPVLVDLFKRTGRSRRANIETLTDVAWSSTIREWRGLLDYSFDLVSSDRLFSGGEGGFAGEGRMAGPIKLYQEQIKANRGYLPPALTPPIDVLAKDTERAKAKLDQQNELAAEFVTIARNLEKEKAEHPEIFPSWRVYADRPAPQVPVLSPRVIADFRGKLRDLTEKDGYVVPEAIGARLAP